MSEVTISKERYKELCNKEKQLAKCRHKYKVNTFLEDIVCTYDYYDPSPRIPSYTCVEKYLLGKLKDSNPFKKDLDDFCDSIKYEELQADGTFKEIGYIEHLNEEVNKIFGEE